MQEVAEAVNRQRMAGESLHAVDSPPPAPAAVPDGGSAMKRRNADAAETAESAAPNGQNKKKRQLSKLESVFPPHDPAASVMFKAGLENARNTPK